MRTYIIKGDNDKFRLRVRGKTELLYATMVLYKSRKLPIYFTVRSTVKELIAALNYIGYNTTIEK